MAITFVSDAVITCRLKGIYRVMKRGSGILDDRKTCTLINYTIREFQGADECESPRVVAHVVKVLYVVLIDMAMKRRARAHDKLRDAFYMVDALYHLQ